MMRPRLAATAVVVALGISCAQRHDVDLEALLPDESSLRTWSMVDGPTEYGPGDLYDYLNGGAERYLSYGFERLLHVRYEVKGDDRSGIDLDLYDMGSELGAFGIYSMGDRRDSSPRNWGTEGYHSGAAAAWKGSVFVHGATDYEEPRVNAALERIMAGVTGRIAGECTQPAILEPLPDGLIPRSERYVASDLLGHAYLPGGVVAAYQLDRHEVRLFFSDLGTTEAAADAVGKLGDHWARWVDVIGVPTPGDGGFHYSDAEDGTGTVVRAGHYVAGIRCDVEGLSSEAQQSLLTELAGRLASTATDTAP